MRAIQRANMSTFNKIIKEKKWHALDKATEISNNRKKNKSNI